MTIEELIRSYYAAFNAADYDGMVALLTEDVVHDINQGSRETGRAAFRTFLSHMEACYSEQLKDVAVLVESTGGVLQRNLWCTAYINRPIPGCLRRQARLTCCRLVRSLTCVTVSLGGCPTIIICPTGFARLVPK